MSLPFAAAAEVASNVKAWCPGHTPNQQNQGLQMFSKAPQVTRAYNQFEDRAIKGTLISLALPLKMWAWGLSTLYIT